MSAIPEPSRTGTVEFDGHRTWYRVTGELDPRSPRAPLLVVHGGPGAAHDYCLAMTSLAGDDRAVVHYDQLGCGRSTHLPDADPAYWTVGLSRSTSPRWSWRCPRRGDAQHVAALRRRHPGRPVPRLRRVQHMPHVEENDAFTAVVGAFLRDHDTPARRG